MPKQVIPQLNVLKKLPNLYNLAKVSDNVQFKCFRIFLF